MQCNVCKGTGFCNYEQVPEEIAEEGDLDKVIAWLKSAEGHDVSVCHCCGDGETWYGNPGRHYSSQDPRGKQGPYAYNGGLCLCH